MSHTRHLVHGQPIAALQLAFCACGWEYEIEKDRWRPPRTLEGRTRAANWRGDEDEVGE